MPTINFQEQFAAAVASGVKRQTIRPLRMRALRAGNWLYLYTGMRTKACRKLGTAQCKRVEQIRIEGPETVLVSGRLLNPQGLLRLAQADGFADVATFIDWFASHYGLPWSGVIIHWGRLVEHWAEGK